MLFPFRRLHPGCKCLIDRVSPALWWRSTPRSVRGSCAAHTYRFPRRHPLTASSSARLGVGSAARGPEGLLSTARRRALDSRRDGRSGRCCTIGAVGGRSCGPSAVDSVPLAHSSTSSLTRSQPPKGPCERALGAAIACEASRGQPRGHVLSWAERAAGAGVGSIEISAQNVRRDHSGACTRSVWHVARWHAFCCMLGGAVTQLRKSRFDRAGIISGVINAYGARCGIPWHRLHVSFRSGRSADLESISVRS